MLNYSHATNYDGIVFKGWLFCADGDLVKLLDVS